MVVNRSVIYFARLALRRWAARSRKLYEMILEQLFERTVTDANGCWLWQGARIPDGYGSAWCDGRQQGVHRLAYAVVKGRIPIGLCVLHRCDVPQCVNPDHLFLGTNADNSRDRERKGRGNQVRGTDHYKAKLTETKVLAIRMAGKNYKQIATEYGISPSLACAVLTRKRWAHVKDLI
jgi:hypothetical protein